MRIYTSHYKLKTNKIKNITIIHLSDIHFDKNYNEKRLFKIIELLETKNIDYICITGDNFDNCNCYLEEQIFSKFKNFLINLSKIAKVIVTLGNHEMEHGSEYHFENYQLLVKKLKKISNITILDNEIYEENNITFIGFNPSFKYYKQKGKFNQIIINEFQQYKFYIKKHHYNILLIHTPKDLLSDKLYPVFKDMDLILSGHTHGGMMPLVIKGFRGIISPEKTLFPKEVRGHIVKNNTNLIICSGIVRLSNATYFLKYFNDLYAGHINEIQIQKENDKLSFKGVNNERKNN